MRDHIAILVQPACCTALLVKSGEITILRQGHSLSVEGFAYGYAFALGMPEPIVKSASRGNAIETYRGILQVAA